MVLVIAVAGPAVALYCIISGIFQSRLEHEASKSIMRLSYLNIVLMTLAAIFAALTYYAPRLWTNDCHCHFIYSSALVSYIAALYTLKAMYITKIYIISNDPMLESKSTKVGAGIATISLSLTASTCLVLVTVMADGECHEVRSHFGCIPQFHMSSLYAAIIMIGIDCILFSFFCFRWFNTIAILKSSAKDHNVPVAVIRQFAIQFALTVVALSSCVADSVIHIIFYRNDGANYDLLMTVFCADAAIVVTCNFAQIPETRKWIVRKCRKLINMGTRTDDESVTQCATNTTEKAGQSMPKLTLHAIKSESTKHGTEFEENDRTVTTQTVPIV